MARNPIDFVLHQVWDIYLNACSCHLDHGNPCRCDAADRAAETLQIVYGPEWHRVCSERWPV